MLINLAKQCCFAPVLVIFSANNSETHLYVLMYLFYLFRSNFRYFVSNTILSSLPTNDAAIVILPEYLFIF